LEGPLVRRGNAEEGCPVNAFTVCVDYHDILAQTAPRMRHHFKRWFVMTSPKFFEQTKAVCWPLGITVRETDAFYRHGAIFNKWAGLEELFDYGGRKGWITIVDADIVWPKEAPLDLVPGKLYNPFRYMYPEVNRVPPEIEWKLYPVHRNHHEHAGYCQIFPADDPVLGPPPWHQTDWQHGGGADSFFQKRWNPKDKLRPSWYCIHIGPCGTNWCGRASAYADGSVPADADQKTGRLRKFMEGRRRAIGDKYAHERIK
jgi:hypothetical protein